MLTSRTVRSTAGPSLTGVSPRPQHSRASTPCRGHREASRPRRRERGSRPRPALAGPACGPVGGRTRSAPTLSGSGEVPPGDPDGTGSASMTVRGGTALLHRLDLGRRPRHRRPHPPRRPGRGRSGRRPPARGRAGLPTEQQFSSEETVRRRRRRRCSRRSAAIRAPSTPTSTTPSSRVARCAGSSSPARCRSPAPPRPSSPSAGTVLVAAGAALLVVARRRRPARGRRAGASAAAASGPPVRLSQPTGRQSDVPDDTPDADVLTAAAAPGATPTSTPTSRCHAPPAWR